MRIASAASGSHLGAWPRRGGWGSTTRWSRRAARPDQPCHLRRDLRRRARRRARCRWACSAEGVAGPLCIRHPVHCQTLFDAATAAGATALRGVAVGEIVLGASPSVTYVHDGVEQVARAPLVVGRRGGSPRCGASRLTLHQDKPHHWFAGLLVDDVADVDPQRQTIGTEGDFAFLTFPQGHGRVRVDGGWSLPDKARFAGSAGPRRFLDAFRLPSAPHNGDRGRHARGTAVRLLQQLQRRRSSPCPRRGAGRRCGGMERSDPRSRPLDHLSRRAGSCRTS
ncbi:hypothetical protein AB5I41_07945 [Sphingomonas sp. MMS24-JH45]